jgi:hypothetical protein
MGRPMLPRPCAGGGPWGFSWADAAAAATSSRIVVLNTWALFFIMSSGGEGIRAGCRSPSSEVYGRLGQIAASEPGGVQPGAMDARSAVMDRIRPR